MLNVFNAPQAAATARVDWSVDTGKTPYGKPTVTEDRVVLGTFDDQRCQVHRFDLQTGKQIRTTNISHQGTLEGQMGGRVVLRSVDGMLIGSDCRSGERIWGYAPSGYPGAVAISDDLTVVGGRDSLTAIRPDGESIALQYNLPVRNATGITLTPEGGVLAQTQQGKLYNITPQGTLNWMSEVEAGGQQHKPVLGPDGNVYTVGFGGTLTALDPDGHERWQHSTGETYVNTPTAGPNGEIVSSTFKGKVTCLEADSGDVRWTHQAEGRVDKTFVHEDGTIFYHNRGTLTALDGEDGHVLQQLPVPEGDLAQAPDGSLVVSTREGVLQRIVLE